jgi:hypothetical protein
MVKVPRVEMAREGGMPFKRQTAFFYQKKNYLYQSKIASRKLVLLTACLHFPFLPNATDIWLRTKYWITAERAISSPALL